MNAMAQEFERRCRDDHVAVNLKPDVARMLSRYAAQQNIKPETAANELLREQLEAQ